MSNPQIAVVILNWNGKALLEKFLPQVLQYSIHPGATVYVADNASSDDSVLWIRANHPEVPCIVLDKNYGFAGGYNRALAQITADYFLLLNSDVLPEDNWLDPIFEALEKHSHVAALMPKIRSYKNPHLFEYAGAAGGFIDKYGYPFCRGRLFDEIEADNGQYDQADEVFWASGAAFLVNAQLYFEVGGLDEHFFAHMEEIDLCWRMKNRGYSIFYVPQSIVYHIGGASLHQSHPRKTYLNFRNNLFLLVKNLPVRHCKRTLFFRMVLDGVAAAKFLLSGKPAFFWAVFRSHLAFYRRLPHYWSVRKQLLPQMTTDDRLHTYNGSIVWQYFIKGIRRFDQLKMQ
jgi:GT2 family glycosyltransferase